MEVLQPHVLNVSWLQTEFYKVFETNVDGKESYIGIGARPQQFEGEGPFDHRHCEIFRRYILLSCYKIIFKKSNRSNLVFANTTRRKATFLAIVILHFAIVPGVQMYVHTVCWCGAAKTPRGLCSLLPLLSIIKMA